VRESNPKFKASSPEYVQGLVEFVSGNMLFVLYHELAHTTITQMGLPVLGKMEEYDLVCALLIKAVFVVILDLVTRLSISSVG
jgi:hypothetical protein